MSDSFCPSNVSHTDSTCKRIVKITFEGIRANRRFHRYADIGQTLETSDTAVR